MNDIELTEREKEYVGDRLSTPYPSDFYDMKQYLQPYLSDTDEPYLSFHPYTFNAEKVTINGWVIETEDWKVTDWKANPQNI